jgi:amino acid transporter
MKRVLYSFLLTIAGVALQANAFAQCAMCKATAESATEHVDKGIGEGLNAGIVYLMMIPYVLLATVALVFFRKKIMSFFRS